MKKLNIILLISLFSLVCQAQIQQLSGPRVGVTFLTNGEISEEINSNILTQYGWQWESRFTDGSEVAGLVEWVLVVGGMERGYFLPSLSSLVGVRNYQGFEFAVGPNLSLVGVGMVFTVGHNFKSGNLNLPVNFAFVPGRDGMGSRFSILVGFNMSR